MPSAHPFSHPWDVTPAAAREIQERLRGEVVLEDDLGPVRYVGGTDVAFEQGKTITRGAVVVLTFPDLVLHDYAIARRPTSFPYVPGLLSFREVPALLDAFAALERKPDLLLCDGQGYAHPRRFGLACHVGVLTGVPSIGVGKSRLLGEHEEVPDEKGERVTLWHKEEAIGAVVRTRTGVKPVYVSLGHRVSLDTAVDYVLRCLTRYRLPETTRWADRLAAAGSTPPDLGRASPGTG